MGNEKLILYREYKNKNIKIKFTFIDTAGQERFINSLPMQYIRDSHIVLLVFSNLKDLDILKNRWYKFYKENANNKQSKFIVVANKSDIFGNERRTIRNLGKQLAEDINNSFFITCFSKK